MVSHSPLSSLVIGAGIGIGNDITRSLAAQELPSLPMPAKGGTWKR